MRDPSNFFQAKFQLVKDVTIAVKENVHSLHGVGQIEIDLDLFPNFLISGDVCWKNKELSYGRGAGTIPRTRCPSHRPDKHAGLCYKRCRSGYKPFLCCLCKRGWKSYSRGVGTVPNERYCPSHRPHMDVGLCYPNCRTEYKGVSCDVKSALNAGGGGKAKTPQVEAKGILFPQKLLSNFWAAFSRLTTTLPVDMACKT